MTERAVEKVWDGRGAALDDARLTIADARSADDPDLKLAHFRILAHVGRQNHRRGWLRVSQTELAERWSMHRNTVCRAFNELVAWGYMLQRTQEDAGESFCLYKVALDGEGADTRHTPGPSSPWGECTPQSASPSPGCIGGVHSQECTCAHWGSTPVHTGGVHPPGERITTRAHRLSPTIAESPPQPPADRGGRERGLRSRRKSDEVGELLAELRAERPERGRVLDLLLVPVVGQRRLDAPSPRMALAALADWPKLARQPDAILAAAVKHLLATRKASVKPSDIQEAIDLPHVQAAGQFWIRNPSPQWDAWLAHMRAQRSPLVRHVETSAAWLYPSEWPPAASPGTSTEIAA